MKFRIQSLERLRNNAHVTQLSYYNQHDKSVYVSRDLSNSTHHCPSKVDDLIKYTIKDKRGNRLRGTLNQVLIYDFAIEEMWDE